MLAMYAAVPAVAAADGLPTTGVDAGSYGVTDGKGSRYVTVTAGQDTVVARTGIDGGKIDRSTSLPGRVTIPAVAYDGSASGLSADGRTLVLIRPRLGFPRRRTTFAVLGARRLHLRRWVTLKGDFSFDAISPDGSLLYLVEYLSPRDPTRYEVRAYDLRSGQLLPQPIVDPEKPEERMGGIPLTRATSSDERWAYTLYQRAGGHEPFIHALDTVGRKAVCIDLPQLEGKLAVGLATLGWVKLDASEDSDLLVTAKATRRSGFRSLAAVDTETFEVSPGPKAEAAPGSRPADPGGGIPTWTLIPAAIAALTITIFAVGRSPGQRRPSAGKATSADFDRP